MNRTFTRFGIPVLGLLLLGSVLLLRRSPEPALPAKAASPAVLLSQAAPRTPPPPAAPPRELARAADLVSLKTSYQSYRTAVATGNRGLQAALKPVLLRSRGAVLELAEQELNVAQAPRDRDLGRIVLESLRN